MDLLRVRQWLQSSLSNFGYLLLILLSLSFLFAKIKEYSKMLYEQTKKTKTKTKTWARSMKRRGCNRNGLHYWLFEWINKWNGTECVICKNTLQFPSFQLAHSHSIATWFHLVLLLCIHEVCARACACVCACAWLFCGSAGANL